MTTDLEGTTMPPFSFGGCDLKEVYLPWSKGNKESWRDDAYMLPMLKQYFEGKTSREISAQLVEEFKNNRLNTPTKKNTETTRNRQS